MAHGFAGCRVQDLGLMVLCFAFRLCLIVLLIGFRAWGLVFRVAGFALRVEGLRG